MTGWASRTLNAAMSLTARTPRNTPARRERLRDLAENPPSHSSTRGPSQRINAGALNRLLAPGSKYWNMPTNPHGKMHVPSEALFRDASKILDPQTQTKTAKYMRRMKNQGLVVPSSEFAIKNRHMRLARREIKRKGRADPTWSPDLNKTGLNPPSAHSISDWSPDKYARIKKIYGRYEADRIASKRRIRRAEDAYASGESGLPYLDESDSYRDAEVPRQYGPNRTSSKNPPPRPANYGRGRRKTNRAANSFRRMFGPGSKYAAMNDWAAHTLAAASLMAIDLDGIRGRGRPTPHPGPYNSDRHRDMEIRREIDRARAERPPSRPGPKRGKDRRDDGGMTARPPRPRR